MHMMDSMRRMMPGQKKKHMSTSAMIMLMAIPIAAIVIGSMIKNHMGQDENW